MIISKIISKENFLLPIESEEKQQGVFDVAPYLDLKVFTPLREKKNLKQVRNGKYYVKWGCGAELSADTIEARWNKVV